MTVQTLGPEGRSASVGAGYAALVEPEDLPRHPLVEAVFEFKWKLSGGDAQAPTDPDYKLLVGSLFDRIRERYPTHEEQPAASIPDQFVPQIIQHRFKADSGYPIVQLGPGIFAVNETVRYSWATYKPTVMDALADLRATYRGTLTIDSIVLRYINAIPFDPAEQDSIAYVRDNLNVDVVLPPGLLADRPVTGHPQAFAFQVNYQLTDPAGVMALKIADGRSNDQPSLIWEISVQSGGEDVPDLGHVETWLDRAHAIARAWFFTVIAGRLEAEYRS